VSAANFPEIRGGHSHQRQTCAAQLGAQERTLDVSGSVQVEHLTGGPSILVNFITTSLRPNPGIMVNFWEIIPFYGLISG